MKLLQLRLFDLSSEPVPEGGGEVAGLALEGAALLPVGQRGPSLVPRRRSGNLLAPV